MCHYTSNVFFITHNEENKLNRLSLACFFQASLIFVSELEMSTEINLITNLLKTNTLAYFASPSLKNKKIFLTMIQHVIVTQQLDSLLAVGSNKLNRLSHSSFFKLVQCLWGMYCNRLKKLPRTNTLAYFAQPWLKNKTNFYQCHSQTTVWFTAGGGVK
jgi:hypothetical protein